jgi:membrane protease YdiL (CAAX protease family)
MPGADASDWGRSRIESDFALLLKVFLLIEAVGFLGGLTRGIAASGPGFLYVGVSVVLALLSLIFGYLLCSRIQDRLSRLFSFRATWLGLALAVFAVYVAINVYNMIGRGASFHSIGLERLYVLVYYPIMEEFMCRGILLLIALRILRNVALAVGISAIIFALIHFDLNGMHFLKLTLQGIFYACAFVFSGSLLPAIGMHIVNNALATVLY